MESPLPSAPPSETEAPSAPALRRRFIPHLLWIIALGTALDLVTKAWAFDYLENSPKPDAGQWWPGVLVMRSTLNEGALFGGMQGRNFLFLALSVLAIPLIFWFFWTLPRPRWLPTIALGAILAGTVGNLYDRVKFGGVRDFIYVEAINWPIFNVADIWILCGAVLFAVEVMLSGRDP